MATTTRPAYPPSVGALLGASEEERRLRLGRTHPEVTENAYAWQVFLDAFEGTGGFLDGSYLWPYPREEQAGFDKRKAMARYHNYLESLVELYVRFVFTQGVARSSRSDEYNAWLADVDGAGTTVDDFLKRASSQALAAGQAGILVDKASDAPAGPSLADDTGPVYATVFAPTHVLDWRHQRDELAAIKLCEDAPEGGILEEAQPGAKQYLVWDLDGWARFDDRGELVGGDLLDLGLVPFFMLRPKPRHRSKMLGRALVSNANVLLAMFNRMSEEDEVLRAQAFSLLTVSVPQEGDVDQVRTSIGGTIGAAKALVVKGTVDYKTPDQSVPTAIRDNISFLSREIYRMAHVRWQRDSLGVESADSIRMQFADLNEMLQGFAKSLVAAEQAMARSWFAWRTPGTRDDWEKAYAAAEVQVKYPAEYFVADLAEDLQTWADALALDLGLTMARRIKKRAARRVDPDLPPDVAVVVDQEIDAMREDDLRAGLRNTAPVDAEGERLPAMRGRRPSPRQDDDEENEDDGAEG